MRGSRWCAVGLASAAAILLAGCASSSSSHGSGGGPTGDSTGGGGGTTIRIASNTNAGALPMWVAIDEGIFAKNGLNPKWTEVDNVGTLPPQLNKTFDFAWVTPTSAVAATSMGIPVTEIAGGYDATASQPASFLMVKKDSSITKLSDLKGKTIGALTVAGTLNYATLKSLSDAGVSQDSVKVISVDGPQQAAQLQAGRIDAVETVMPFYLGIAKAGGKVLGHPYQSIGTPLSAIWWGANPGWASQHPAVAKKFRTSLEEAIQFIKGNQAKARAILMKYTKLPPEVIKAYPFPAYNAKLRPQDIPKWISIMKTFAGFKGNVDPSKLTFSG